MKIDKILSCRNIDQRFFWQIVFEWEDVFVKELHVPLMPEPQIARNPHAFRLPILDDFVLIGKGNIFRYDLSAGNYNFWNNRKVIPCIIDFNLSKEKIAGFEKAYNNHKVVCISSLEAYHFLKENNTKLQIEHLPLSLPDKYKLTPDNNFDKKYDLVLMGRQNPVLSEYLDLYVKKHPSFVYVYRPTYDEKDFRYFTSKGEYVGEITTRKQYMELMSKSRCAFYSTQCVDGGPKWRNGFNQVTPRFFEILASGCHIIARYTQNPDTDFYQIEKICPMCDSYEFFERALDQAREVNVDLKKYADFLNHHYTSTRVDMLNTILNKID